MKNFSLAAKSGSHWVAIGTATLTNGRVALDLQAQKFFPAKTRGRENAVKSCKYLASETRAVSVDWEMPRLTIRTVAL